MNAGLVGAIVGTVLGLAGGVFGTYCSIKNTQGPLERALMVKASVVVWIAVALFLVLLFATPAPYRFFLWIPYGIFLLVGINKLNRRIAEIRAVESAAS